MNTLHLLYVGLGLALIALLMRIVAFIAFLRKPRYAPVPMLVIEGEPLRQLLKSRTQRQKDEAQRIRIIGS